MAIDLHVHSTASDGTRTPVEVVEAAHAWGCTVLSLTDHDTVDGIEPASRRAAELGIEFIPGIEINTDVNGEEVHILGYYIDPDHPELVQEMEKRRNSRVTRARRMVEKLEQLGAPVRFERVMELAQGGSVGRIHIVHALIEAGHVRSKEEAWERFLKSDGPAYVPRDRMTPEEAVRLILRVGGIPVLAHPGLYGGERHLPGCLNAGLMGLEVYYKEHTPAQVEFYRQLAEEHGLLMTGGTDCHGPGTHRDYIIGDVDIPDSILPPLREAAKRVRASAVRSAAGAG